MTPATLNASNDLYFLALTLVAPSTFAERRGFETAMAVKAVHWDGDHEHPIKLDIEGLFFSKEQLLNLCNSIDSWVNQPLDEMADSKFEGEFGFEVPSQSISLSFGERDDLITAQNQGVSIRIACDRFTAETSFVTDQSCLRRFSQAVRRDIDSLLD